jgi:signal transduction histidine kinase/DNA-binding NarL/FixJ family response regulator
MPFHKTWQKLKQMDKFSHEPRNIDAGILLLILRNIPDFAVLLVDNDENIILAEGSEIKNLVSVKEHILNRRLLDVFKKTHYKTLSPLISAAYGGTTASQEFSFRKRYYYLQAVPVSIQQDKANKAIMLIYENTTEEKHKSLTLELMKKKAETATKAKSEFLSRFSHEVRTPLNSVVGFTNQLAKTQLNKTQQKFLDSVKVASNHILSVLDETLSLSRIEAGEIRSEKSLFTVQNIVNEIIDIEGLKAEMKGLKLRSFITEGLNRPLVGDHVSLKQILLNLTNNAIKFTTKGSVTISAKVAKEKADEMIIRFSVIDTGIGIPEKKLKTIFHSFKHADSDHAENYEGSGLGLFIVKKSVYIQGGHIDVKSKPGQGTEFIVTLAFEKPTELTQSVTVKEKIDPGIIKNIRLLLADDDEMSCELAALIFDEWEIDYDIVNNGSGALDLAGKNNYNVVLLDIHMPDINGMEVAQQIRENYKDKEHKTVILAVTANVLEKDLKRYVECGIDGYLLKPYREEDLFDIIVRNLYGKDLYNGSHSKYVPAINGIAAGDQKGYDLSDLRKAMAGNKSHINNMLNKFISNAEKNIKLINIYLEKKQWDDLGETAHKMIPSFRHLNINHIVEILEAIEKLTLYEKNYTGIGKKVKRLTIETFSIIEALKKEFK